MPALVNEHQTAFVRGRFIAENFLATREVLHHVNSCKSPAILLKLDFEKAFDSLDWGFLLAAMKARGFPDKFLRWISHLLSTSSSYIQVNGQLSPPFFHERGLRQGDPISPYLFIIAADVLQQMTLAIQPSVSSSLSPKLPRPILTFQYADDTIMMVSARGPTIQCLLLIIHCFAASSGLRVNFTKSSFVPLSISAQQTQQIENMLKCKSQSLPLTYLGMPLSLKAPKRQHFLPLLWKLESRLQGWKTRFISRAGKLQLVKTVLSSIPTYFMSCFSFPKWLLHIIDIIQRRFLWSRDCNRPSIPLLNWRSVCLPIQNGGLGVVNLHLQNLALLLRWLWGAFSAQNQLWHVYATRLYAIRHTDGPPHLL